jgi:N-acyl-D-amino-acid deacylase
MDDLVIRGGTVTDGTGAPQRTADVAITDGRTAGIGYSVGAGRRQIDATGLVVCPGFVDRPSTGRGPPNRQEPGRD